LLVAFTAAALLPTGRTGAATRTLVLLTLSVLLVALSLIL